MPLRVQSPSRSFSLTLSLLLSLALSLSSLSLSVCVCARALSLSLLRACALSLCVPGEDIETPGVERMKHKSKQTGLNPLVLARVAARHPQPHVCW